MDRAKRIGLRVAMLLVAVNVWTGSPLLALWIGSRVQGDGAPQMDAVFIVLICFAGFSFGLAFVLARLESVTGTTSQVHRHVAWLRSMRGERPQYPGERVRITPLEQTLVIMVVACVVAFEIWFFFFSSSPIDQRSGRGSYLPPATERPAVAGLSETRELSARRYLMNSISL